MHTSPRSAPRRHVWWQLVVRVPTGLYAAIVIGLLAAYNQKWDGLCYARNGEDPCEHQKSTGGQIAPGLVAVGFVKSNKHNKAYTSQALIALLVSIWEFTAFIKASRDRPLECPLVALDVIVMGLAFAGTASFATADYYWQPSYDDFGNVDPNDKPWGDDQNLCGWVLSGMG